MSRRIMFAVPAVLVPLVVLSAVRKAEPLPPAAEWIPGSAVVVLEVNDGSKILDCLLDEKLLQAVQGNECVKPVFDTPQFKQLQGMVDYLEMRLNTDWKTALRGLFGGKLLLAAGPQGSVVAILDTNDARLLHRLHDVLVEFAENEAKKRGQPDRVMSRTYRGVTGWTFNGGKEVHALVENRLVWANKSDALKAVIDQYQDGPEGSLATRADYRQVKNKLAGSVATLFVNMDALKHAPGVERALRPSTANPLGVLLASAIPEALRNSSQVGLGLTLEPGQSQDTVRTVLRLVTDGKLDPESNAVDFALPGPDDGVLPNLDVPRKIAAASFYRQLADFYAAKDELFPERTSGLIFFENMMGIFFSGRHFTDEVLSQLDPYVRFVVASQQYDPAVGIPEIKIPAFATVFHTKDTKRFPIMMEEAWQKALGLTNFLRGQQAQPGLIIDRPTYKGVKYTVAYFSDIDVEDRSRVDSRFNFRPTLAMVDGWIIMSSTEQLAKDLIDLLKGQQLQPVVGVNSLLEIDGENLLEALRVNWENLVRQNMIEEGHSREEAERTIGIALTIASMLKSASLKIDTKDNVLNAVLEATFGVPATEIMP